MTFPREKDLILQTVKEELSEGQVLKFFTREDIIVFKKRRVKEWKIRSQRHGKIMRGT